MERTNHLGDIPPLISCKTVSPKNHSKNSSSSTSSNSSQSIRQAKKAPYKKACERPAVSVARRNARERGRVHVVNQMFGLLKSLLPTLKQKTKRVSKLKILKAAMDYMYDLQSILENDADELAPSVSKSRGRSQKKIDPRHYVKPAVKSTPVESPVVVPVFSDGHFSHQADHRDGRQDDGLITYFRSGHMSNADAPMDPYNDYRASETLNNARLPLGSVRVIENFDITVRPSIVSQNNKHFVLKSAETFTTY